MRVAGICCFSNEADIIEPFARHWLAFCDQLILLDHGSADESAEIVRKLQREGLPIHLVSDPAPGHFETEQINRLFKLAAHDFSADWIFCIDADELIDGPTDASFLPPPGSGPATCIKLKLRTYYPRPTDDPGVVNIVERITHRVAREPQRQEAFVSYKVVVPGELARKSGALLTQGKHQFFVDASEAPFEIFEGAWMAHFSLRSHGQYAAKIACRQLQKFRHISADGDTLDFYDAHYRLIQQGYSAMARNFHDLRVSYAPEDAGESFVRDPFRYRGGPLRYTSALNEADYFIRNLMAVGERLARSSSPASSLEEGTVGVAKQALSVEVTSSPPAGKPVAQSVVPDAAPNQILVFPLDCPHGTEELQLTIRCPSGMFEVREIALHYSNPANDRIFSGMELKPMLRMIEGGFIAADATMFRIYFSNHAARLKFQGWNNRESTMPCELELKFRYENRFQPQTFLSMPVLNIIAADQRQSELDAHELERLGKAVKTVPMRGSYTIDFTDRGNREFFIGDGWNFAEPWGSWTDGDRASFKVWFAAAPVAGLHLRIVARGLIHKRARSKQTVTVGVNGKAAAAFQITTEKFKVFDVNIPLARLPAQECEIHLDIPDSVSPHELGLSDDTRRLGIGVERIELHWLDR